MSIRKKQGQPDPVVHAHREIEAVLSSEQKLLLHRNLTRAMTLDRLMMRIIKAGLMVGFYHEGGISLAPGVAAGSFLRKDDSMWPHYRAHGIAHLVAKGVDVKHYVAEHMGREAGCCKGRSSYHASFPQDHVFGFSGNIGASFGNSVGWALAAKYRKTGQVAMSCSGDGAYCEGRSHEAMIMAASGNLPIVFWCEANGIMQHTSIAAVTPFSDIADLCAAYGIPALVVDGQDVFACGQAACTAIAHVRSGKGPFFVECKVLRAQEHNVGGVNYEGATARAPELMEEWKATRDPLKLARAQLMEEGLMTWEQIEQVQRQADEEAEEILRFSESSPKALPTIEELQAAVFAE